MAAKENINLSYCIPFYTETYDLLEGLLLGNSSFCQSIFGVGKKPSKPQNNNSN